jgi:1-aminocyclopropane-1-carboxylate deaminase/D-cysteine desulfhydrase-like pyridoxal-dependent ACC family enzyme
VRLYREHTPIETHEVRGFPVFVKRDDLYGVRPAPPLGKLRGLRPMLRRLYDNGHRLVGCWDSRVSNLGEGLAAAAAEFGGLRTIVCYPTRSGVAPPSGVVAAERLGARIHPVRGNVTPICLSQARRHIEAEGGVMLPFGLECELSVAAIAAEAARTPVNVVRGGTVVVCAGSGVTLAGLLRGLPASPTRMIAVSSGRAPENIKRCVTRNVGPLPRGVVILDAIMPYYGCPGTYCPFPCHPNYDLKAWTVLTARIQWLPPPVLFWNIGA